MDNQDELTRNGAEEMRRANSILQRHAPGIPTVETPGQATYVIELYESGKRGADLDWKKYEPRWMKDSVTQTSSVVAVGSATSFHIHATSKASEVFREPVVASPTNKNKAQRRKRTKKGDDPLWLGEALMALKNANGKIADAEVARQIGINKATLSRSKAYQDARKQFAPELSSNAEQARATAKAARTKPEYLLRNEQRNDEEK